jgi:hypothetical protein
MRTPRVRVPTPYRDAVDRLVNRVLQRPDVFQPPANILDIGNATQAAWNLRMERDEWKRRADEAAVNQLNTMNNLAGLRGKRYDPSWHDCDDAIRKAREALQAGDWVEYRTQALRASERLQRRMEAELTGLRKWRARTFEVGLMLRSLVGRTGMTGETPTKMNQLADEMIAKGEVDP